MRKKGLAFLLSLLLVVQTISYGFFIATVSAEENMISIQSGESYQFVNNFSSEEYISMTSTASILCDIAAYEGTGAPSYITRNHSSRTARIPSNGGKVVVTNNSASTIKISINESRVQFSKTDKPALVKIEVKNNETYEFYNSSSYPVKVYGSTSEKTWFDYAYYEENGQSIFGSSDISSWNTGALYEVKSHGIYTLTNTNGATITLYAHFNYFTIIKEEQGSVSRFIVGEGEKTNVHNYSSLQQSITAYPSSGFTALIYDSKDVLLSKKESVFNAKVAIPADGYVIIGPTTKGTVTIEGATKNFTQRKTISGLNASQTIAESVNPEEPINPLSSHADPIDTATGAHYIDKTLLQVQGAIPLTFRIHYHSLLLRSDKVGQGWSHDYETYIEKLTDEKLIVHWNKNSFTKFQKNQDGTYLKEGEETRFTSIIRDEQDTFILSKHNGEKDVFSSNGVLLKRINAYGQSLLMHYNTSGVLESIEEPISGKRLYVSYNPNGLISKVSDTAQREVIFEYNSFNQLIGIINPNGQKTEYSYNKDGQVITGTRPNGEVIFTNTYDNQGRVITQKDGRFDNNDAVTTFAYAEDMQLGKITTTVTNRNGDKRVFTHDNAYRLLAIQDELGSTIAYTYNEQGQTVTYKNENGGKVETVFDEAGNAISIKDSAGRITRMTYDSQNNLLSIEKPSGEKITNTYNQFNRLISTTNEKGDTTTYNYDDNNLLVTIKTPEGGTYTNNYEKGLLISSTDPMGVQTSFGHDEVGRLTSIVDGEGKTSTLAYDKNDHLLRITNPLGESYSFTYDVNGRRIKETDPKGYTTQYKYDGNNNVTSEINALGEEKRFVYDAEDQLIQTIDAQGNATTFTRDARGRIIKVLNPIGQSITTEYDASGNIISEKDTYGQVIRNVSYNELHLPIIISRGESSQYTYQYDNEMNLVGIKDPLGQFTRFSYGKTGNIESITDSLSGKVTQHFDLDGNRTKLIDPNGNESNFSYDKAGRLTSISLSSGSILRYEYNKQGKISRFTNARGITSLYTYDDAGRLLSIQSPSYKTSYTYDKNGNVLTKTDPKGTLKYEYDKKNRVIGFTDVYGNVIRYAYDKNSNLTTLTYPDGKAVTYSYDKANQLVRVVDWAGRATSYTYDANGNVLTTTRPDGSIETRTYNADGEILSLKSVAKDGTIIVEDTFTYDTFGNVISEKTGEVFSLSEQLPAPQPQKPEIQGETKEEIIEPSKEEDEQQETVTEEKTNISVIEKTTTTDDSREENEQVEDSTEQDTSKEKPISTEERKKELSQTPEVLPDVELPNQNVTTPDEPQIEIEKPVTATTTVMTYTKDNRLATYNGTEIKYDADGNMLNGVSQLKAITYQYDEQNRLVKAGELSYDYDANNNRVSRIEDGVVTRFVINPIARYSQLLLETDIQGKPLAYYVYGMGLLGVESADGQYTIFHFDRRGSTVALSNKGGQITDTFEYEPYGELIHHTGNTKTLFLYNGRYGVETDSNGLYYMRSRYYSPEIKRFINQDILIGDPTKTQSLNRFAYVNGQPISQIDPFGLSAETDTLHTILDYAGILPVVGIPSNVINTYLYIREGRYMDAGISTLMMIPGVGMLTKAGKLGKLGAEAASISKVTEIETKLESRAVLSRRKYILTDEAMNEHILVRHGPQSDWVNTTKFNKEFNIEKGIAETIESGSFSLNTDDRVGYIFSKTFDTPIGITPRKKPINNLKVVTDDELNVVTAYPTK